MNTQSRHRIVVSIINYRTAEMTLRCVQSVLDDLPKDEGHVVVVDNASGDGSADKIAAWLAARPGLPVTLLRADRNSGFSGGHNQGMGHLEADFYLILNSDALLRPGFFRQILAAAAEAETGPKVGLWAPRLEDEDGTPQISCFRFPSPWSEIMRGAKSQPVARLLARRAVPLGIDPDPAAIAWASFACILVDGRMRAGIGPMDEGYFLYFEDIEYCLRAHRAGWRVAHVPQARAVHLRGGSAPVKQMTKAKKRLPAYYYASRTRFFRQAYGPAGPLLANLGWLCGRSIGALRRLTGAARPAVPEAMARDIWTNFTDPLGDRRAPEG